MLDTSLLGSVARQLMSADEVEVMGRRLTVRRTSKRGLRTVTFTMEGRQYAAIEQNPDKPSKWGELARSGHQVVQFKDIETNKFVRLRWTGRRRSTGVEKAGTNLPPTGGTKGRHEARCELISIHANTMTDFMIAWQPWSSFSGPGPARRTFSIGWAVWLQWR